MGLCRQFLVGASAAGSYEVRPTPMSETAPGVFVLATALDNLLAGEAVRVAPAWLGALMILLMTTIPAASVLVWRSITAPLGATLLLLAAYGGACFLLYGRNYWLPMAAPMLAANAWPRRRPWWSQLTSEKTAGMGCSWRISSNSQKTFSSLPVKFRRRWRSSGERWRNGRRRQCGF